VLRPRAIPCLLLRRGRLVKTVRFANPKYVGDPINAVRIFNDMEVDEIVVLDIGATVDGTGIPFDLIGEMASECFMPMAYGGAVRGVEDARRVLRLGVEKVVVNSAAASDAGVLRGVADAFGSQAVVASVDVRKRMFRGYRAYSRSGRRLVKWPVVEWVQALEAAGAGEILLTSIDRDGTMDGYDLELVRRVSSSVRVPVIAAGGAGSVQDMGDVVAKSGASAAAVGSLAVYQGRNRAVLINFPTPAQLKAVIP
jgi:imidazole glycerol-phosphate synthase subunit HisF